MGDGAGDRSEHPAGDAEEVENVLQEGNHHHAGHGLGEAGNGLHEELDHGEDVDLQNVCEEEGDEQADEDGKNVVKPVLHEVRNHAVLTEKGELDHQLVNQSDNQANEHGCEHTAGAKLGQIHQVAAVHTDHVHTKHIGADAGKSGDHGPVLFLQLGQAVIGDDKDYKQSDHAEGIGAQSTNVWQDGDKTAEDSPQRGNGADHREGNDVQNRIGHNAKPEVLGDFVHNGNQVFFNPRLNRFHNRPPPSLFVVKVDGLLQNGLAVQRSIVVRINRGDLDVVVLQHIPVLGDLSGEVGTQQQQVNLVSVLGDLRFADSVNGDIQILGLGGLAHIGGHKAGGCSDATGKQNTKHNDFLLSSLHLNPYAAPHSGVWL